VASRAPSVRERALAGGLSPVRRAVMMSEYMAQTTEPIQRVDAVQAVELPRDKAQVQKMLRRYGHKGLKIESIEPPRGHKDGTATARVYALTQPKLTEVAPERFEMLRAAVTVVFVYDPDEGVYTRAHVGWVVDEP
jgi:hypothetical protein